MVVCLLLVAVQGIPLDMGFGGVFNNPEVIMSTTTFYTAFVSNQIRFYHRLRTCTLGTSHRSLKSLKHSSLFSKL